MTVRNLVVIVFVGLLVLAGCAPAAPPPVAKVTYGELRSAVDGPVYIALEKGYFKEQGIDLELILFSDTNEMVAPLTQGQLHVGSGGVGASLFNAVARDIPLKIVADKTHREKGEKLASGWMARQELLTSGKLKSLADIKGKVLGLGSRGAQPELEMGLILQKAGLKETDVETKDVRYTDQLAAFVNGSIDVAYTFEPHLTAMREQKVADMWLPSSEVNPGGQVSVIVYGPALWKDQPDLAKRWMIAFLKGVRDYTAAFHEGKPVPQDVIDTLVKYTSQKKPEYWANMQPNRIHPDGVLSMESLEFNKTYYQAKGYIKTDVSLKDVVDTSFAENAVKVLGSYKPKS